MNCRLFLIVQGLKTVVIMSGLRPFSVDSTSSGGGRFLEKAALTLVSNPPLLLRKRTFGRIISDKGMKNSVVNKVLQLAWARFDKVKMTEVDDRTMAFEFQSEKDKEQILDLSPWAIQGQCLNLKDCVENTRVEEIQLNKMQVWTQIHGLSLDIHNHENATNIGNSIGRCLEAEKDSVVQQRTFLRVKLEVDVASPLVDGFWWTCKSGKDKWVTVKYVRLSDICYVCGRLGHTSVHCGEPVARSELSQDQPRFGPWMTTVRPRAQVKAYHIGGVKSIAPPKRNPNNESWRDVMNSAARGFKGNDASRQDYTRHSQWMDKDPKMWSTGEGSQSV